MGRGKYVLMRTTPHLAGWIGYNDLIRPGGI